MIEAHLHTPEPIERPAMFESRWSCRRRLAKVPMIETTVSHYNLLEKLGSGGMGVVFKAEDSLLKRTVALKFLSPDVALDPKASDRLLREAQAASALDHPNICTIYEVGRAADGQLFICMAHYEGETLAEKLTRGPLGLDQAVDFATQIARGLAAAHARGMVHRDIKPANMFVTRSNIVKILDFGLAKLPADEPLPAAELPSGTVAYMAPEQIQGTDASERTDLWAFGVMLFEMLTGSRPFQGEHPAAVMYEILNVEPRPLNLVRPEIGDHLSDLIADLLRKDPAKRTGSAQEVIDRLHAVRHQTRADGPERSIAILYFENMSMEKETDYFCAGIADDIITDLSRIRDLKVLSRTDVLPFRNKEINTRDVGRALHVSYVLEGSVRKSGSRVRITAQLMDVRTGFHIWADRYDRMLEDIFDLQNEVSSSIAAALSLSLTDAEKQSLARRPTVDVRAHDFYMRGTDLLYKRGKRNTLAAIQMFENAVALDPNYLAAYSGLAEGFSNMLTYYDLDPKWLARIIAVAEKMQALDPSTVEGQFTMGRVYFQQKRFGEARETLEKVVALRPDSYDAHRWLAVAADIIGDYDTALAHHLECARLKPFSEEPWMFAEMTWRRKGNQEESEKAARRMLQLAEAKLAVNPDDLITLSRMTGYYVRFGQKEKAVEAMKRVRELDPTDGLALYNIACSYAVIGDKSNAMDCLQKAFTNGYGYVRDWVKNDPDFQVFRDDPEFKAFIA